MTDEQQFPPEENPDDQLSTGLQVLAFCVPLAGAIIYFSNKSNYPNKAKAACHAALWGFGVGVLLNILLTLARQSH